MVADVIEGYLDVADVKGAACEYVREHFRDSGGHRMQSLDADLPGDTPQAARRSSAYLDPSDQLTRDNGTSPTRHSHSRRARTSTKPGLRSYSWDSDRGTGSVLRT